MKTVSKRRQARPARLTPQEAEQYRNLIQKWAQQAPPEYADNGEKHPYTSLTLSSGLGRAVYASYSDEDLLAVLHDAASRLGRAPTQDEVFSLYRIYLKADWSQMLAEEPEICGALEDVTRRRCRLGYPPRKRDVPQAKILCERFRSWENVIAAAEHFEKWQEAKMDN